MICDRCGAEYEAKETDRTDANIEDEEFLTEHTIPKNIHFCTYCYNYLILQSWSSCKYQRSVSDISYKQGHIGDYAQASRHNPKCREFDIKYGFLNPETNRYWDEKEDNK